jgi:hypothetical protein
MTADLATVFASPISSAPVGPRRASIAMDFLDGETSKVLAIQIANALTL